MRFAWPLLWLAGAVGAMVGFAALGGLTDVPLRWSDLGGWIDEVSVEDALVELARWLGMALSAYVIVVSVLVLLGELAATVRAVPLARLLRRVAAVVAVPALRRRLVEASTATAITMSAMSATAGGGGALAASPAVEQHVVASPPEVMVLPAGVSGADVVGFGYDPGAPVATAEVRVVVEPGDTVWDIAVAHYGFCDQSIVDLVAAASDLEDPSLILAGQVLVLPPLPAAVSVAAAAAPSAVPAEAATWAVHTIVVGDTLWDIVRGHYGFVTGDLVWDVAVYNGIDDPSDIPVGTAVTLPPLAVLTGDAPPPTTAATPAPLVVEAPAPVVETVEASPDAPEDVGTRDVEVVPLPAEASPPERASVVSSVPASPVDGVPTSTAAIAATEGSVVDGGGAVASWLVGLAGATTLSAGLLAVYRRLRRGQTSAGARAWRLMPSGESARLHRQLVAAADLPLVRWAGQELSGVLFGLGRPMAGPVAVELSDLTGVELLWDAPMPDAPAPWEATPGGWSWRLLYDPAAEVPDSTLPAAIPGLVTLGRRDDAQVLVDLEAFGSVSIAGDVRAAEDVLRAVVLEFGSGEELSDAWVSTVGLGVDGVEHLSRVQARSDDEALRHARGIVADERRVMADAGVEDTFVLRTSGPAAAREVTVIAVRAESCEVLDELVALAAPRSGLVLVALGAVDGVGLRAVVDDAGAMDLEPLGMVLEAIGVSHEAASNTAVLLDAAASHLTVEDLDSISQNADRIVESDGVAVEAVQSAVGRVVEEVAALCGPDGVDLVAAGDLLAGDEPDAGWERPTPGLLVRVLGKPRLEPEPAELTRHERMVVVRVASSGGEAPDGAIRDAVWGGGLISDKRFWNVVGHIRSQLGAEVCPVRATGPRSRLVRLEDTATDLGLLEAMAARAERVPSSEALGLLVEGLALVYGEPFDDVGYEWAMDLQLPFRAAKVIEAAALRAVDLALAADDVVTARTAVAQALIGLPGNELLYRARMRIEGHAGNRAGIRSVYAELVSVLADLGGDSADAGEPSPATKQLFEQLVDSARQD